MLCRCRGACLYDSDGAVFLDSGGLPGAGDCLHGDGGKGEEHILCAV